MIVTDQQYEATKERMARFEEALAHAEDRAHERHPLLQQVLRKNVETALHEMYDDLIAYDQQRGVDARLWLLGEAGELPWALVRARIMAGLTQEDLADRLALAEDDLRQYEATHYAGVGLDRVQAVATTLGLRLAAVPARLIAVT